MTADTDKATAVVDSRAQENQREIHRKTVDSCNCVDDDSEDNRRSEDHRDIGYTSLNLVHRLSFARAGCLYSTIVFACPRARRLEVDGQNAE